MIFTTKTKLPKLKLYNKYLNKIWKSNIITNNGKYLQKFEKFLKKKFRNPNINVVANGTIALQLAIKSLNIKNEVITTPFSYVATANAIKWENCVPIFVDINQDNFCINANLIEKYITKKTSAILVTHVYGIPCNIEKISKIAKKYNLKVIYDASHTFGINYKGKPLFTQGDASTLSFHATKIFHTGEGGAIYMKNKKNSFKVDILKKFGHTGELKYYYAGINGKMSELHAALGLALIQNIGVGKEKRKKIHNKYFQYFSKNNNIKLLKIPKNLDYNYSYFPILLKNKNKMLKLKKELFKNKIIARRYFYPSLDTLKFLNKNKKINCPISQNICSRVLCLPIYQELNEKDQKKIIRIVNQI
jgi:dTDP-4-amino-4,6-dideoxygalactose transaminase